MDNTKPSQQCKQFSKFQWVDTQGNSWNTKRKDEGLSSLTSSGYKRLTTGQSLHRVIFEVFVRKLKGNEVINHKDGNKLNNSLDNLEATTSKGNSRHSARVLKSDTNILKRKLTDFQVLEICNLLKDSKDTQVEIAKKYNVTNQAIYAINMGNNYSRITEGRFNDYPIRGVRLK